MADMYIRCAGQAAVRAEDLARQVAAQVHSHRERAAHPLAACVLERRSRRFVRGAQFIVQRCTALL